MKEMDMMRKTMMMTAAAAAMVVPVVAAPAADAAPVRASTPAAAAAQSGPFFGPGGGIAWRSSGRFGRGPRLVGFTLTAIRYPDGHIAEAITMPRGCRVLPVRQRHIRGGDRVSVQWACRDSGARRPVYAGATVTLPAWRAWV